MRVFVTGGTGFVGTHLVRELANAGHELTVLSRTPEKWPRLADCSVTLVQGSLCDRELDREVIQGALNEQDAVIHNAVVWGDEGTDLDLEDSRAACFLFQEAAQAGVGQCIFTSSAAVHRPFRGTMSEQTPLAPSDYYGATKATAELFLSAVSKSFPIRGHVLRLGPVVGPPAHVGGPHRTHSRIADIVRSAVRDEDIRVPSGGRQLLGATDAARAFRLLLESEHEGTTLLCADPDITLWRSIAELAIELADSSSRVEVENESETPPRFDTGALERTLGLRTNSRTALRDHVLYLVKSLRRT